MSYKDKSESEINRAFIARRNGLRAIARRAGSQDDEDIVQDAFLKAFERSLKRDVPTVDKFLSHIVRCLSVDRRRRRVFRSTYAQERAGEDAVDAAADPERGLISAQRLKRVVAVIDIMPARRREAFLLARIDGLTYAQIASRMSVSIKAVEKHIYLAMLQLSDADD